jgi:hypothetical protein
MVRMLDPSAFARHTVLAKMSSQYSTCVVAFGIGGMAGPPCEGAPALPASTGVVADVGGVAAAVPAAPAPLGVTAPGCAPAADGACVPELEARAPALPSVAPGCAAAGVCVAESACPEPPWQPAKPSAAIASAVEARAPNADPRAARALCFGATIDTSNDRTQLGSITFEPP